MAQLLIRDLDPDDLDRLKAKAKREGRSLQMVAKRILQQAARQPDWSTYWADVDQARESLASKGELSVVDLIREDRDR